MHLKRNWYEKYYFLSRDTFLGIVHAEKTTPKPTKYSPDQEFKSTSIKSTPDTPPEDAENQILLFSNSKHSLVQEEKSPQIGFVQRKKLEKNQTIDTEEEAKKIASVVVEFTKTGSTLFIPPYLDKKAYKLLTDEQRLGPRIMKIPPKNKKKPAKARRNESRAGKRKSRDITESAQTDGAIPLQTPKSTQQTAGEIPQTPKCTQNETSLPHPYAATPSPSPDAPYPKHKKSKKRRQDIEDTRTYIKNLKMDAVGLG